MSISAMPISKTIRNSKQFQMLNTQEKDEVKNQLEKHYNKNYKSTSQLNMAITRMVKGPDDSELFCGGENPQKIDLSTDAARALLDITSLSDSQKNQIIKEANP